MLGAVLLGQKKHAEAEPLLRKGYEGMKRREAKIAPQEKIRLAEAAERLIALYETTGRSAEAEKLRPELNRLRSPFKPPGR